jgi:ribosomal protein L12E/L44/L45/RPP1/RPP2
MSARTERASSTNSVIAVSHSSLPHVFAAARFPAGAAAAADAAEAEEEDDEEDEDEEEDEEEEQEDDDEEKEEDDDREGEESGPRAAGLQLWHSYSSAAPVKGEPPS